MDAPRRSPITFEKGTHRCWQALYPSIWPEAARARPTPSARCCVKWQMRPSTRSWRVCAPTRRLTALDPRRTWRDADLVVEFHGESSARAYWEAIEPQLPQLRLAYAAVGGMVVTTTATREPLTLMRSTYKMWPPRITAEAAAAFNDGRPTAKGVGLMSFAEAVRAGSLTGLLARALLAWPDGGDAGDVDTACSASAAVVGRDVRRWAGPFNCCAAALVEARRRLSSFDVVGTTECTPRYWRALAARLERGGREGSTVFSDAGAVAAATRAHGRDGWLKPAEPNGEFRAWAAASIDADTEDERRHRRALQAAAVCDVPIHADGMRRAGVLPVQEALDVGRLKWIRSAMQRAKCDNTGV